MSQDEEFVVVGESRSQLTRTLRVYDPARGDFEIDIPGGAKVTFGYFNPATTTMNTRNAWSNGPGSETIRTTALRIYEKGEKGNQLACFMGVSGFRDKDAVKMTRLTQKITIEHNFEDDGMGKTDLHRKAQRALLPVNDDEIPF